MPEAGPKHPRGARDKPQPYEASFEHLRDELARIDLLVRMQVVRARAAAGDDAFRGLAISEHEVDALLARAAGTAPWEATPPIAELETRLETLTRDIGRRGAVSIEHGVQLRLVELSRRFGLDRFELDVVLVALLPELDSRYERLYAYLHDDVTRKRPSVDLALSLLCRSFEARVAALDRFAQHAPLLRHGLVRLVVENEAQAPTRLTQHLKLDDRVAAFLIGSDALDSRLRAYARPVTDATPLERLTLPEELRHRLAGLFSIEGERLPLIYLRGAAGAGRTATAAALCAELDLPLITLDVPQLLAQPEETFASLTALALRETRLVGAGLLLRGADALLADDKQSQRLGLERALADEPAPIFLAGVQPWPASARPRGRSFHHVDLPPPSTREQLRLWQEVLASGPPLAPEVDLLTLAGRYRLTPGRIRDAAATAHDLARFRGAPDGTVDMNDLSRACRQHAQPRLGPLAHRVSTVERSWDDLVVTPDALARLREIANQARHRRVVIEDWNFEAKLPTGRGLGVLFVGPPGTGKTLAASIIANELGLDLYRIDLASVVSKFIGETEKQLAQLFDEAETSRAILFFDEADALFGKRTEVHDAHDRYANISTSYLLQRMDEFEGTVILASNLRRNIDDAFTRRLRSIVEFSHPDERERLRIWQRAFPAETPLGDDVSFAFMAKTYDLAGGHIRNIALAAAFMAAAAGTPVEQRHLLQAARREYQNLGQMIDDDRFTGGG